MVEPLHTLLTLPGWMGSDDGHWQTQWERLHGARRVEQDDWLAPEPAAWESRLEEAVQASEGQVTLVAHSLGCHLVARWAASSPSTKRIRHALLVAPPDLEGPGAPSELRAWTPLVAKRLPFRSLVVYSTDDPYCPPARALALADGWGSATHAIGARGHVNSESHLEDWPEGYALLAKARG